MKKEKEINNFQVIVLGIIFDPKERKILVGKRENDPYIPGLKWVFPGGRLTADGEINKALKDRIRAQTGLEVKNLGAVFSKTYEEKRNFLAIYFLCEAIKGKPKAGEKIKELKWVKANELEDLFSTSFHPRLKEYLIHIAA